MLSERQLNDLLKLFEERMQDVTEQYLIEMGEHLKAIGRMSAGDVHRITQMKKVGVNAKKIQRELAKAANMSIDDLYKVFMAVAEQDERFAQTWFAEGYTPPIKGPPKLSTPIERMLKAQLRVTAQEFKNLSQTTIVSNLYRNAVDVAVQTVQTGITDYRSAIRSALKKAAVEGLRVYYPNSGTTRRLDTAVRQNVLDGVRSLNQGIMNQLGNEYGADGVEVSAHALCAEDHLPYQGHQYSKKDFDRIQNTLRRPLGQWNCKHFMTPIILGINQPAYSEDELSAYADFSSEIVEFDGMEKTRYEWSQEQRRIETAIRQQKNIAIAAKASGDDTLRRECQAMINRLTEQYEAVSSAAGIVERKDRMTVSGFHRVKANPVKK